MNYAVQQRLRLIDFLLDHYGRFNRSALVDYFGISTVQASADIQHYRDVAGDLQMVYDASARTYTRHEGFKRFWP